MRIEQLEYFLQVANYGSLSLTAKKINVGQPTLSAAIAGLEKEVGRPLFRRTRRGMDLTAFGREILPLVEKTVDDYYDIRKKAGITTPQNLHVYLQATNFTSGILNEALYHTRSMFPDVSFTLRHALASDVLHDISDNTASIGLSAALDFNLSRHREYANSLDLRLMPQYNDNLCLFVKSGGYFQSLESVRLNHLPGKVPLSVPGISSISASSNPRAAGPICRATSFSRTPPASISTCTAAMASASPACSPPVSILFSPAGS